MTKPKSDLDVGDVLEKTTVTALERAEGNRTLAAEILGINLRTLRNWIRKMRLAKRFPARSVPYSRTAKDEGKK